ncbi:MAG: hypothetical protein AABZ39_06950 [Spirochaetota bacterium]
MDMRTRVQRFAITLAITALSLSIVFFGMRIAVDSMMPSRNPLVVFLHDYLDLVNARVGDTFAKVFNINGGTVATYQLNLVKQTLNDYLSVIRFQEERMVGEYPLAQRPVAALSDDEIEALKRKFYLMSVENPYIKSLTFFGMTGDMLLQLYLEKGWSIKLKESLIREVREKKMMILHSATENMLYCLAYHKTAGGEFIACTRTDKNFLFDIIAYYQLADRTFYLSDGHNVNKMIVREGESSAYNIISIIGKFAKNGPMATIGFSDVPGLTVSVSGRSYSTIVTFVVLFITALLIAVIQQLVLFLAGMARRHTFAPEHVPNTPAPSPAGGVAHTIEHIDLGMEAPVHAAREAFTPVLSLAGGGKSRVERHRIVFGEGEGKQNASAESAGVIASDAVAAPEEKKPEHTSIQEVFAKFDEALSRMIQRDPILSRSKPVANASESATIPKARSNDSVTLGNA